MNYECTICNEATALTGACRGCGAPSVVEDIGRRRIGMPEIERLRTERDALQAKLAEAREAHAALIKNYGDVMDERNAAIRERDSLRRPSNAAFRQAMAERDAALARAIAADKERDDAVLAADVLRGVVHAIEPRVVEAIAVYFDGMQAAADASGEGSRWPGVAAMAIRAGDWRTADIRAHAHRRQK